MGLLMKNAELCRTRTRRRFWEETLVRARTTQELDFIPPGQLEEAGGCVSVTRVR